MYREKNHYYFMEYVMEKHYMGIKELLHSYKYIRNKKKKKIVRKNNDEKEKPICNIAIITIIITTTTIIEKKIVRKIKKDVVVAEVFVKKE